MQLKLRNSPYCPNCSAVYSISISPPTLKGYTTKRNSTSASPCAVVLAVPCQACAVLVPVTARQVPAGYRVSWPTFYQYQHLHQTSCKSCRSETSLPAQQSQSPPSQFLQFLRPESLEPYPFSLYRRIPGVRLVPTRTCAQDPKADHLQFCPKCQ